MTPSVGPPTTLAYEPGRLGERHDEMLGPDGSVRAPWRSLVGSLSALPPGELGRRRQRAERLLLAEGASHVLHTPSDEGAGPWPIDPIPFIVEADEWATLAQGVAQRARLLDALLRDLYGDQQ